MSERRIEILSHLPLGILSRVEQEVPGARLLQITETGELAPGVSGEVLLTQAWGSPNLAEVMKRGIRWVHAYGTGVDRFPFEALEGRPLTCSRGASAVPISEWVLAMVLAAEKKLPDSWVHAPPRRWSFARLGGVHGKTLGLIGLGSIGEAVARRALAFGMRVLAVRRTAQASPLPGVEIVTDLDVLLAEVDHLVLAAPATPETRALLNRDRLAKVKPGMHVINIARGELIDQDALREALDDDRVGLASLDVTDPEPLPEGHWLYHHPKVRLSPHTSWCAPGALDLLLDPFLGNLRRYLAGEKLTDRVDVDLGY